MSFSKINYNSTDEIFDIKILDNERVIEKWKFQKIDFPKWVNIISRKYGIKMTVKTDSDLDWAI